MSTRWEILLKLWVWSPRSRRFIFGEHKSTIKTSGTRWSYCVECPQYSIRLEDIRYLFSSCIRRRLVLRAWDWVMLVLLLKPLSPVISLPSYALSAGSGYWRHRIQAPLYKVLATQPPHLHNLISVQRLSSTRSSSVVTLARPSSSITHRSFRYASPCLWNQLPLSLRQLHSGTCSSIYDSPIPSPITSSSVDSLLRTFITPSLFHSRLKPTADTVDLNQHTRQICQSKVI